MGLQDQSTQALINTGFEVYLTKKDVQTAIRSYFLVAWLIVATLGSLCCRARSSLRILSGKNLTLASMTGWIRGFSVVRTAWKLRSVPGGWLGFIMIATFPLSLLSDIGLNYFLIDLNVAATCQFISGLVLDPSAANPVPSNQGQAYVYSNFAQTNADSNYYSLAFGGRSGAAVYRKANNDTSFLPRTDSDVIGFWNCNFTGSPIQYSGQTDPAIEADLLSRNLLYPDFQSFGIAPTASNGTLTQNTQLTQLIIVSWSSATVGDVWDIRAVVDMNDTDPTTNSKSMQGYHCQGYDSTQDKELTQIISKIAINDTMPNWMAGIQGVLYPGIDATAAYADAAFQIAWIMNNMMMVSGSQQSVSHVPANGASLEYGCYESGTQVTIVAVALIVIVTLMVFFLIGLLIYLKIAVKIACKKYDRQHPNGGVTAKQIIKSAPGNLLTWIQHASYEGTSVQQHPDPTQLKSWNFVSNKGSQDKMGILTPGAAQQPLGQPADVALPQYGQSPDVALPQYGQPAEAAVPQYGSGYVGYGNPKGGYSKIQEHEV